MYTSPELQNSNGQNIIGLDLRTHKTQYCHRTIKLVNGGSAFGSRYGTSQYPVIHQVVALNLSRLGLSVLVYTRVLSGFQRLPFDIYSLDHTSKDTNCNSDPVTNHQLYLCGIEIFTFCSVRAP